MGKRSILLRNNGKSQRIILHDHECNLPEIYKNQVQEGLTKFHNMFAEFSKESDRVHACSPVATPQHSGGWTHHPRDDVATDTKDSDLDNKYSMIPLLSYPEESNDNDCPSNAPSEYPTPDPGPQSEKPTK